jgi:hypothetical protein
VYASFASACVSFSSDCAFMIVAIAVVICTRTHTLQSIATTVCVQSL